MTVDRQLDASGEATAATRRLHPIRRVTGILAGVTLAAAVLVIVLVVAGTLLGAWRIVPVRSGSMAPLAPKGSAVVAGPAKASQLHVGDVVLFRAPVGSHPLVVHRIQEIVPHGGERLYRTKGDANAAADPWLIRMRSTTVWRVHHVIPWAGTAVDTMAKPVPRFVGIVLASLVILGLGLARIWRRDDAATADATPATDDLTTRAASAARAAHAAAAAVAGTASAARVPEELADDAGEAGDALHTA